MNEGAPVSKHAIKIMGFGQKMTQLGFQIPETLAADIILMSVPSSFKSFVQNYRMNGMDKTANELLAMLRNAELTMQADPNYTLAVSKTTSFKKKGKTKDKATGKSGAKTRKSPLVLVPTKILSASTAKLNVTRRETARSTWQIERSLVLPAKV